MQGECAQYQRIVKTGGGSTHTRWAHTSYKWGYGAPIHGITKWVTGVITLLVQPYGFKSAQERVKFAGKTKMESVLEKTEKRLKFLDEFDGRPQEPHYFTRKVIERRTELAGENRPTNIGWPFTPFCVCSRSTYGRNDTDSILPNSGCAIFFGSCAGACQRGMGSKLQTPPQHTDFKQSARKQLQPVETGRKRCLRVDVGLRRPGEPFFVVGSYPEDPCIWYICLHPGDFLW